MKEINAYLTKNPYFNDGKYIAAKDLRGFILHSVGVGQPDAQVFLRSWNQPNYTNAGIHGFITPEAVYYTASCLEYGKVKRMPHAGKRWSNDRYIGFEMTEPAGLTYTGGDRFTVKDRAAAREFVAQTYRNAVSVFAKLCFIHGKYPTNPDVILSHREAGQAGIATTHTDPEHLWKGLGLDYTMDTFREDVAMALCVMLLEQSLENRDAALAYYSKLEEDGTMELFEREENRMLKEKLMELIDDRIRLMLLGETDAVPKWAKKEYAEAIEAGITDGSNPNAYATRLQAALMAYRASQKG